MPAGVTIRTIDKFVFQAREHQKKKKKNVVLFFVGH